MRKDKIKSFYLSPYTKITSRWAKDLNVKKQPSENFRRNFKSMSFEFQFRMEFLEQFTKSTNNKGKY